MSKQEYEDHPLSSVLPLMGRVETDELAADIQANGLRAPITLLDGKILDGRNRYRACKIVNVEPRFRDFNGDGDPLDFIVSVNVKRRHLTASQKAMVVAKIAQMPRGDISRIKKSSKNPIISQTAQSAECKTAARAAKDVGVSTRTVEQAKQVLRDAPQKTVKAVERGEKSVATAVREIKETKDRAKVDQQLDRTGYPIPENILEDWQRAEAFNSNLRELSRIKGEISKALDEKDVIFREVTNTTVAGLKNIYGDLKRVLPHAVCTSCQGVQKKKCTFCKGRGFISEFTYRTCVTDEVKKLREAK